MRSNAGRDGCERSEPVLIMPPPSSARASQRSCAPLRCQLCDGLAAFLGFHLGECLADAWVLGAVVDHQELPKPLEYLRLGHQGAVEPPLLLVPIAVEAVAVAVV